MKTLLIAAAVLVALSTSAIANGRHSHGAKTKAKSTAVRCPVTGDKIASVKAAYNHEMYKGKTYYFCCPECKPRFDKNRDLVTKHSAMGKYEKM